MFSDKSYEGKSVNEFSNYLFSNFKLESNSFVLLDELYNKITHDTNFTRIQISRLLRFIIPNYRVQKKLNGNVKYFCQGLSPI